MWDNQGTNDQDQTSDDLLASITSLTRSLDIH